MRYSPDYVTDSHFDSLLVEFQDEIPPKLSRTKTIANYCGGQDNIK